MITQKQLNDSVLHRCIIGEEDFNNLSSEDLSKLTALGYNKTWAFQKMTSPTGQIFGLKIK